MRHNIVLDGFAFRLRPVHDDDADFIVAMRNTERARYLHKGATSREQQITWLQDYYGRHGDYYFVVESRIDGLPKGLIALYDFNASRNDALWGRWIVDSKSLCATESVWLIHRVAFEIFNLDSDYSLTAAGNASVISFHDACGYQIKITHPRYYTLEGDYHDAIEHRLLRSQWPAIDQKLRQKAYVIYRKLLGVPACPTPQQNSKHSNASH